MSHAGLPAFVRDVHFIEDRVTALERAVDAVQSATGAAWVAAYTPDGDGLFTVGAAAGEMPFGALDAVDHDDEAMVALRAERGALDAPPGSVLAGALVLPFVAGGRITGLLAVGAVPYAYTPAERESLMAVASAVGLALEVLQGHALRRELARCRERADWAERELAVLHRVLDGPPSHAELR
jgi:GAF domain-containing protein